MWVRRPQRITVIWRHWTKSKKYQQCAGQQKRSRWWELFKLSKIFFFKLLQACWMLRFWKGKVTRHFFAGHPLKFVNLYWNISTKAIAFGASVKYHAWLHINRWLNTSNNKHYYNICCNFCIIPSLKFMSTFSGLELLFHGAQEDGHGLSPQLFAFKTFPQTFKIKKPEIPGLL